jgi:hypothetical protein
VVDVIFFDDEATVRTDRLAVLRVGRETTATLRAGLLGDGLVPDVCFFWSFCCA